MQDPGSKAPPSPNDLCTMATSKDGHKETDKSKLDKDVRDEEGGREGEIEIAQLPQVAVVVPAGTRLPAWCEAFEPAILY